MTKLYARWQKSSIAKALQNRRVVIVSGARQSGKTTLVKQFSKPENPYRVLDDTAQLRVALEDPRGFVKHKRGTMIIDEIQKAPLLLPAIKLQVDEDNAPGQFLLTGSANIYSLPETTESLAGRVANIHLRPLSIGEILEREPVFLETSFKREWPMQIRGYDKATVIKMAFRGGYPEVLHLSNQARGTWHKDYVRTLLARDLKDIANIRRKKSMQDLLEILASWSGKFMDISGICGKLPIAKNTLETYSNLLEALYLFERAPAWLRTDYDRVGRRDKLYSTDTGLMANILNWSFDSVFLDPDRSGKIVETLVFNELSVQIGLGYNYSLSQYRDRKGREIDFIVENDKGELLGIEVKSGSMVSSDDGKHLRWFRDNIALNRIFTGIVLYTGENTLPLETGIYAVPVAALWS
jgi:predicted AAA+ superfamily ATPase